MKKRVLIVVAVMLISIMALAGCSGVGKAHMRTVTSIADLKVAMGEDMVYPEVVLKDGEFFDSYKHKDDVSLPEGAKNNEIYLLYIPPISEDDANNMMKNPVVRDELAYRYSIKQTLNAKYGEVFKNGTVELCVYGTNYTVKGLEGTDVKLISVENRQKKLDGDNKKDKEKLGDKYISRIVDKAGVKVLEYENKNDKQAKRYFTVDNKYSYEMTITVYVDESNFKNIKDKTAKANAVDKAYTDMFNAAKAMLDGYLDDMLAE